MCYTGLCKYEHPTEGECELRHGQALPSDAYCSIMDHEYEEHLEWNLKEHDPETHRCEYKGNNMWSCGHIDNQLESVK